MDYRRTDKTEIWSTWTDASAAYKWCETIVLIIAYGLILLALWTPWPGQEVVSLFAVIWVLLTVGVTFDGRSTLGFRWAGFRSSLWVVGAALLVAIAAVVLASQLRTLDMPPNLAQFFQRYTGYAIWSFFQEFLLLGFFLMRLERLFPGRRVAVMVTGLLFAVAHMPNPLLTVLTLFWGWATCWLFLRYRNLYTLGLTHAILGICIALTIPGPVHHNMRVGIGYLTYIPEFRAADPPSSSMQTSNPLFHATTLVKQTRKIEPHLN